MNTAAAAAAAGAAFKVGDALLLTSTSAGGCCLYLTAPAAAGDCGQAVALEPALRGAAASRQHWALAATKKAGLFSITSMVGIEFGQGALCMLCVLCTRPYQGQRPNTAGPNSRPSRCALHLRRVRPARSAGSWPPKRRALQPLLG